MLFVVLMVLSLISAIASQLWTSLHMHEVWYLGFQGKLLSVILSDCNLKIFDNFLIFVIVNFIIKFEHKRFLCHNLIQLLVIQL